MPRTRAWDRAEFLVGSETKLQALPWKKHAKRWIFEGDPLADTMTPAAKVHQGPIVVFVDDATNSAAVELVVALLAQRPSAVVIGTETRGGCARHTGEFPVVFTTSDSVVPIIVSLVEIKLVPYERCTPGRGIQPDVQLVYDEATFTRGSDPFLEALRGL